MTSGWYYLTLLKRGWCEIGLQDGVKNVTYRLWYNVWWVSIWDKHFGGQIAVVSWRLTLFALACGTLARLSGLIVPLNRPKVNVNSRTSQYLFQVDQHHDC